MGQVSGEFQSNKNRFFDSDDSRKALESGILSSHNTADFTLYGEIQLHVLMKKRDAWEGRSQKGKYR